jgi:Iron-containing redox enzyme
MTRLPPPRGPLSDVLLSRLKSGDPARGLGPWAVAEADDPIGDDDLQLTLACCYELAFGGFEGVDDRWEWEPSLLGLRAHLEAQFENALRRAAGPIGAPRGAGDLSARLIALSELDVGPSLSRYLMREATPEQFREFVIHRSIYTLKEADPHTFVIPRLAGAAKAALVEIQTDEYGEGDVNRMHATLFADTMRAFDLDDTPCAYLDQVPGTTLATVNLVAMFGLHRRLRGAAMGHLALFELSSAVPNRRYGNALRRLGMGEEATRYYDEHVEADSVHDMIAAYDLAGAMARQDPSIGTEILFGAFALAHVETGFADALLGTWGEGRSSLLEPGLRSVS